MSPSPTDLAASHNRTIDACSSTKRIAADLLITEYQQEFDRKSRLDSKTIGQMTFLSMILTASLTLTAVILSLGGLVRIEQRTLPYLGYFVALVGVVYFSLWAIGFGLWSYRHRQISGFNPAIIANNVSLNEEQLLDAIIENAKDYMVQNMRINAETVASSGLAAIFLTVAVVCFTVLCGLGFLILVGG